MDFEKICAAKLVIVYDGLHGCGAGYLDGVLAGHGIPCVTLRANRDVLFDGTGPDVSEENLAPLKRAVIEHKAAVGLATDGDADRFGIFDSGGAWISPNHILALLYDYLVETRGWKLPAARSVATTHLLDPGVSACCGDNRPSPHLAHRTSSRAVPARGCGMLATAREHVFER